MSVMIASMLLSILSGAGSIASMNKAAAIMRQAEDDGPFAKLLVASPGIHLMYSLSLTAIALAIAGIGIITAVVGILAGAMLIEGYRAITAK